MIRIAAFVPVFALASALPASSTEAGQAKNPGPAKAVVVGTYDADLVGAGAGKHNLQLFRLGKSCMLIVVPDIKQGPQPGHTTAVEGALVVADANTVKVQIVPSTLPLLLLKGDDPKTIYKKAIEKKAILLIAEKITE